MRNTTVVAMASDGEQQQYLSGGELAAIAAVSAVSGAASALSAARVRQNFDLRKWSVFRLTFLDGAISAAGSCIGVVASIGLVRDDSKWAL